MHCSALSTVHFERVVRLLGKIFLVIETKICFYISIYTLLYQKKTRRSQAPKYIKGAWG